MLSGNSKQNKNPNGLKDQFLLAVVKMSLAMAEVAQSAGKRLRGHSFLHQQIREETRIGTAKRFAKLQDARRTQSLNHRELDGFTEQQTLVEAGGHHFVKLMRKASLMSR